MRRIEYPFVPKSTTHLEPGQFWTVPLSTGKYACGRVIQIMYDNGKRESRMFLAGLMDWVGKRTPTSESIAGCKVLKQGAAHIKTIRETGGKILGCRSLEADGIEAQYFLSQSPGKGCMLMRGYEILRPATRKEQKELEVFSAWGYGVIKVLAEHRFRK